LKSFVRTLPRLVAALAFAASTTAAIVIGGAAQAGSTPATPFNAVPQAADAAVFVGVGFGGPRYPRWRWDGYRHSWVRFGFGFGSPGFVAGVGYYGYAPPLGPPYWVRPAVYVPPPYFYHPWGYRPYWHPYYRPYFYGGYRGGWRREPLASARFAKQFANRAHDTSFTKRVKAERRAIR
jgi:hypothetical protein